jgi:hypothetical protein
MAAIKGAANFEGDLAVFMGLLRLKPVRVPVP